MDRLQELIKEKSAKYNIPEKQLSDFINDLFKNNLAWASLDKDWKYPSMGDSEKSCPMLRAMFRIEQNKGIILYLPYKEEKRE